MVTTSMISRNLTRNKRQLNPFVVQIPPVKTKTWTKFTYYGNDIRTLAKIFINSTIKTRCKLSRQYDKYNTSGVYQLKCLSCEQVYIGQMGRDFRTTFKEHIRDIRFNQTKSKYAHHILECNHKYGTTENTMEIITAQKGRYLDVLERFHI
jgi:hypothetical protein